MIFSFPYCQKMIKILPSQINENKNQQSMANIKLLTTSVCNPSAYLSAFHLVTYNGPSTWESTSHDWDSSSLTLASTTGAGDQISTLSDQNRYMLTLIHNRNEQLMLKERNKINTKITYL